MCNMLRREFLNVWKLLSFYSVFGVIAIITYRYTQIPIMQSLFYVGIVFILFYADHKNRSDILVNSLPVSRFHIVAARYSISIITATITAGMFWIVSYVSNYQVGEYFGIDYLPVALLLLSVLIPAHYFFCARFILATGIGWLFFVIMEALRITGYVLVRAMEGSLVPGGGVFWFNNYIFPAVCLVGSFILSVFIYQKKEF